MTAKSRGPRCADLSLRSKIRTLAFTAALTSPIMVLAQESPLLQVQQHLRAVDTMTAQFTQTDRNGGALTGELTLKRPGKARFQYRKGVPRLVVVDGGSLIFIDYRVRQVSRLPIGSSPLSVLLNPTSDLARIAKLSPQSTSDATVIEARDPRHPESGTYTFSFARISSAPAGLMLQGWTVLDPQGNRTTVRLTGQRLNVPVSDKVFRWVDPRQRSR